jgi:hypothetical protein
MTRVWPKPTSRIRDRATVEAVAVACVFAAAVIALFFGLIFGHRILLDPSPLRYDPWRNYASQQDLGSKLHQGDNLRGYLPRQFELWRSLHSGRLPLWNPYAFCGTPFLADPQARVLYPISIMLGLVRPPRAMGYDVALHFFISLVGMYLFMRVIGGTRLGSMVGAFAYGFSSFFFTRYGQPTFVAAASWVPFFFYSFEKAQRAEVKGTLLLTGSLALGFLAGFPQVFFFGVGALLIYAAYMSIGCVARRRWRSALKNLRVLAVSGLLALLLVAATLIPFYEFVRHSTGLGISLEDMKRLHLTPPVLLLKSLLPDFFGNAVARTDWTVLWCETRGIHLPLFMAYCGIGGLLAAICALVFIRRSRHIGAFLLLLILSAGAATSPLMLTMGYRLIPFLGYSSIDRIAVVSCLAVASLAGIGFSMISGRLDSHTRRRLTWLLTAAAGLAVIGAVGFALEGRTLVTYLAQRFGSLPDAIRLHSWTAMRSAKVLEWVHDPTSAWFAFEKAQVWKGLVFVVLGAGFILLSIWPRIDNRRFRNIARTAFLVCLIVDTLLIARTFLVSQPDYSFFEPEGIGFLKGYQGRGGQWRTLCVVDGATESYPYETAVLPPNTNQIFGICSLQGTYTMMPLGHSDFLKLRRRLSRDRRVLGQANAFPPGNMPVARLMCVRHVLESLSAPPRSASPVLDAISAIGAAQSRLRIMSLQDDSRLALIQTANRPFSIDLDIPEVGSLDFGVGWSVRDLAHAGPVVSVITCQTASGRVELRKGFDPSSDGERWHDMRLDLASVAGNRATLTLTLLCPGLKGDSSLVVGWSSFEFVSNYCEKKEMDNSRNGESERQLERHADGSPEKAYRVTLGAGPGTLSLRLTSDAREVPLEIVRGDGSKLMRWVGFPADMHWRTVLVDLGIKAGDSVVVRSDSAFCLEQAKIVQAVRDYVDYDLVYDKDMRIYENFAATAKTICVDRQAVPVADQEEAAGEDPGHGPVLQLASLGDFAGFRCGESRIVAHGPERIVIEASTDRDCYLLLQDTYYPGWRAQVDGSKAEILRTDLGARAVGLGAGKHVVVFEFRPGSVRLGLMLSCIGVALTVIYGKWGSRVRLGHKTRRVEDTKQRSQLPRVGGSR